MEVERFRIVNKIREVWWLSRFSSGTLWSCCQLFLECFPWWMEGSNVSRVWGLQRIDCRDELVGHTRNQWTQREVECFALSAQRLTSQSKLVDQGLSLLTGYSKKNIEVYQLRVSRQIRLLNKNLFNVIVHTFTENVIVAELLRTLRNFIFFQHWTSGSNAFDYFSQLIGAACILSQLLLVVFFVPRWRFSIDNFLQPPNSATNSIVIKSPQTTKMFSLLWFVERDPRIFFSVTPEITKISRIQITVKANKQLVNKLRCVPSH